ncbi:MAG: class I SAM-dependent methyltransferase [Bacteroidales bacterium]|nr:class I SAM-dependent methyltransferase [Bacteroidales bacterium]
MKEKLRSLFFKIWYWYISTIDKNAEVIFMNFGYSKDSNKIDLKEEDEPNRYSAQLYHLVASGVEIKNKNILEVGCGRGGGLSYVNRYFSPAKVTGVDLNNKAIEFCKKYYKEGNETFFQANAQVLPFENDKFDVVLNVESSHRYLQMDLFLNEVKRVLKKGGYLSFTDFRESNEIEELHKQIVDAGFIIEQHEDITENVVEALKTATPDRIKLVEKLAPKFLHKLAKNFAAVEGSETYNFFKDKHYKYVFYVLKY